MNEMDLMIKELQEFEQKLNQYVSEPGYEKLSCDEHTFVLLLSSLSSFRKIPGMEGPIEFDTLYVCPDESDRLKIQDHLNVMYGITDADSLWNACDQFFSSRQQYYDFLSFWNNTPVFDEDSLRPETLVVFRERMEFSKQFRPFVGNRGFLAWDINERINLARSAYAGGLITEDVFWQHGQIWAREAVSFFSSWAQYAMSCLCGSLYFMFCFGEDDAQNLKNFFDIQRQLLTDLFEGNDPVGTYRRRPFVGLYHL